MSITSLASLVLIGSAAAAARGPNCAQTVSSVDLKRYMGRWYVVAAIPNFLGRNNLASSDTYTLNSNGRIEIEFTFRKGSFSAPEKTRHGRAVVSDTQTSAEWKVRFNWPFTFPYLVLDPDSEYQWAVVGTPNRKFLRVLARKPQIPDDLYARILGRLAYKDFNVAKLKKVPQPSTE